MSLRAVVVIVWLMLPILPGRALVARGSFHDMKLLLGLGALYLLGSFLLASAMARPGGLATLRAFLRTGAAKLLFAAGFVGLAALALSSSVVVVGSVALFAATWFLLAWRSSAGVGPLVEKSRRLMLLAASCAVALACGEAVVRIPAVADATLPHAHRVATFWPPDRYDAQAFVPWRGRAFRSFHLGEPKTPGTTRIVVLGDSFTWGEKIADTREIWPYVLESTLRERNVESEVINLAKRGNTTVNELEYLQRYGWDLDPDAVVIQYLINDPLPSWPDFQSATGGWLRDETRHLAVSYTLHKWLNRRSYLYSLADQRFADAQVALFDLKDLDYFDLHVDGVPAWEVTKAAIRTLGEECRAREVPLLFVMFPYLQRGTSLGPGYPYEALHAKLRATVEAEGIRFLDLVSSFAAVNEEAESWHVLPMDAHPGILGHQVAGEVIADQLMAVAGWEARASGATRP